MGQRHLIKTLMKIKPIAMLVGAGLLGCTLAFIPEANASDRRSESSTISQQQYCPDRAGGGPQYDAFETDSFYIFICTTGNPEDGLYYHGVSKNDYDNYITLPAYVEEGTGYVAENQNYTYIVNGLELVVYDGNRVILTESVWRE